MEFSHKKTLLHENLQHVIEVVHKYFFRELKSAILKRQWSQLHAQVDPKKCTKKMEGHNIYGEILAFKATNFQHEDRSLIC